MASPASIIKPFCFEKGKSWYRLLSGLIKRKVNWKQTEGIKAVSSMAISDLRKDSILRRAENATPKSCMKVRTCAAS